MSVGQYKARIAELEEKVEHLEKSCDDFTYITLADALNQERYSRASYEALAEVRLQIIHKLEKKIARLEKSYNNYGRT